MKSTPSIYGSIYCLFLFSILFSIQGCGQKRNQIIVEESQQWKKIGPGGGGSTFIPTFSYSSTDDFMIRCDMTGAYITNNGGLSYAQVNFPNGSSSFAYHPSDSAILFIGSSTLNRSKDGGKSWQTIFPKESDIISGVFKGDHANYSLETKDNSIYPDSNNSNQVKNIRIDADDPNKIYFSIDQEFFYSVNGGADWSKLMLDNKIEFIYTNSTTLVDKVYAFTPNGVYVLDKENWEYALIKLPELMQPAFSFTGGNIKGEKGTIFYALHNNEPLRGSGVEAPTTLWYSKNLGNSWQQAMDSTLNNFQSIIPTYSSLAASENDAANIYVIASSFVEKKEDGTSNWYGALKSTNKGKSWKWVWKGGGGSGQYAVKDGQDALNLKDTWVQEAFGGEYIRLIDVGVAPNDSDVAIVTDWYRTMKTTDGGNTWSEIYSKQEVDGSYISRGVDVTTTYGVHFDPFDKEHIAISYTDIGYHHSYNGGKSWVRSTKGIPSNWHNTCYWMVFDPNVKGKIWSVWSGLHDFPRGKMTRNPKWKERGKGGVAVSVDGGRSWTPTVEGMGFDSPSTSIVLDENSPVENRILYVSAYGKGVFKSIDGGQSWELRNNGITGSLAAFEITILPDGTLFLITSATPQHKNGETGRGFFMGAVYRSTDGADSWQKLDVGEKVQFPNGLTFDPQNPDRLYVGSWADISLSDLIGSRIAMRDGGKNELFDLDGGIVMSNDGGDTWTSVFDKDEYVYDVTVDINHPGRVYCNTFSQGAYRSDDYGKTWNKLKGYDFHWGHRVVLDDNDAEKVYLTTFGSSVWHGKPETE